jgi:hypothetical protein
MRAQPQISTELPDVRYDPDTPWVVSNHAVQRHVRSYASHHCLNSNDHCPTTASAPPVTSYSTRVEKLEKNAEAHTWVLTLRRLERLHESHRILAEWWTETFDAVVLATGPYTAPHVPDIDGIVDWSKAMEGGQYSVYHSQAYRHPERYANKVHRQIIDLYNADMSEDRTDCGWLCFCLGNCAGPPLVCSSYYCKRPGELSSLH